jgi:pimeloyl-ACP methyl ester carboxylesterase
MKTGLCDVKTAQLSYRLYGKPANPLIVVETALGACSAEWWHLAEKWSGDYSILLYDRAGYDLSSRSSLPRSPEKIATELKALLDTIGLQEPAILIGHSMGGLYAQQFARMFPERACGLILLDPVSPKNYLLKEKLTPKEYYQCRFDKSANMKMGLRVSSLGLGGLLKPLLKKGPPFYYYNNFSSEAEKVILRNFTQKKTYQSSLAEYAFIDSAMNSVDVVGQSEFPDIPLVLICHTHEVMTAEMVEYGGAEQETAARCDEIWLSLMEEYLNYSSKSIYLQARNSGHFIHLSDPDIVWDAINTLNS